jgi:hypothetical protein
MKIRYFGPGIVVSRNKGGAYIVCELDGLVYHRPIAAFRLIPYFARKSIPIPDDFIDINIDTNRLCELEETELLPEEDIEPSGDVNEMAEVTPKEIDEEVKVGIQNEPTCDLRITCHSMISRALNTNTRFQAAHALCHMGNHQSTCSNRT